MRKIHNIAVGLYALHRIFLNDFIPDRVGEASSVITSIVGLILIVGSIYFLFIDRETKRLKVFDTLTSTDNSGNYLQLWFLLFITSLDPIHPFGTIFYLTVSFSLLLFCVWTIVKEILNNRVLVSGVIIGHVIFGFFMYSWSKGTYVRHYGNEIIGSFWEKPNYKTKYLVKLYKGDSDQFYTLPAQLHIFSETFDDDFGDGYQLWTEKFIMVETIYFNNGSFLTFDDCDLNEEGKVYCIDQDGNGRYIELTKKIIK